MATRQEEDILVAQLQKGERKEEAFSKLVALYKERLYWHVRNMVKNHEDANDVLQNTFIKIFRYINNFKGDSKLYSWMYRIATNESITFINKKANNDDVLRDEMLQYILLLIQTKIHFV